MYPKICSHLCKLAILLDKAKKKSIDGLIDHLLYYLVVATTYGLIATTTTTTRHAPIMPK